MIPMTISNGKTNKLWLKNRILNGTVLMFEQNQKNDNGYKLLTPKKALAFFYGLRLWFNGDMIIGCYGTSYYYKFTIKTS